MNYLKTKTGKLAVPLLCSLALITSILLIYTLISTSANRKVRSVFSNLPQGWNAEVKDESLCYSLGFWSNGSYEGTIEEYVRLQVLGGSTSQKVVSVDNSYNITSPNVIVLGPQGVGLLNTIYVKSADNNISVLTISDIRSSNPEFKKLSPGCPDVNITIHKILDNLL